MTPSELEAIRTRCEAATDDPWTAVHDQEHNSLVDAEDRCVAFCARRSDADSIVQTRQDIQALLANIATIEADVQALAEALQWALSKMDRGDGVLEYTGALDEADKAKEALVSPTVQAILDRA